ncbi:MAG: carboxypeptidase-like regulatory domain-containing protein [Bryobacteraceae bacterium]
MLAPLWPAQPVQESGQTGSVILVAKDPTGAAISSSPIRIQLSPNTPRRILRTGGDGRVTIDLPTGIYDLKARVPGFNEAARHIEVQAGPPQVINIVLSVGSCPPGPCVMVRGVRTPLAGASQSVSPDGRYVLVSVDGDTVPRHTVFLEDRVLKARRKLFNYSTLVDILWAPDSKLIAVTDHVSSNKSQCTIFSVDEKTPPIQVLDLILRTLSEDAQKDLKNSLGNQHSDVEPEEWLAPTVLMLKVTCYDTTVFGDEARYYTVDLNPGQH